MAITVTDAMNAMGQDWECSEVLRAEVRRLRADLAAAEVQATESKARNRAYETFIRWLGDSWKTGFTYMGDTAARKYVERYGRFASREEGASWTMAWRKDQIQRYVKPAMDALAASDIDRSRRRRRPSYRRLRPAS